MITDEEARKLAEEVLNYGDVEKKKLAHKVKELLDRQRWIPCSEKFPPPSAHCEILIRDGDVPTSAHWNGSDGRSDGRMTEYWALDNSINRCLRAEVTHWRESKWPFTTTGAEQ